MEALVRAPASKAHTLRGLIIGSLAEGTSVLSNPLLGEDQLNVIECLKQLGVGIEVSSDKIIIEGSGGVFSPVVDELNVGESGVGMNFLSSVANLCDKAVILTGAKRITERPIFEVVDGLRQLGCKIEYLGSEGFPPIKIDGGGIGGGVAEIRGDKTSQYFSSIVTSAPYAREAVTLRCVDEMTEKPYFDISLGMMSKFGIEVENDNYKEIKIAGGQKYSGIDLEVEGDYSSASFFFLAAAICQSKVTVSGLSEDTHQGDKGFLDLMAKMGCKVSATDEGICVEGTGLAAITVDMSDIPDLVPPAAIACGFADGVSRLTGIGHLRHKECDRLAVMAAELNKMGIKAECGDDSLIIEGNRNCRGAVIDPHNDHRIAMSFAVAGLVTGEQVIEDEMCVAKSFPDFWERFEIFHK